MESTYRVHYFDGNGRAVNLRAILEFSGTKWEDNRINFADWPALKASGKFEFGQLPVLEVDGKQKTQTIAMEIFLAKRFGLLGSNEEDEYQIVNLLCAREDYSKHLYSLLFPTEEQKAKREEIVKNITENVLPIFLKAVESRYVNNGKGKYFLGDKFSLADIFLTTGFAQLFESPAVKDLFSQAPVQHSPLVNDLVRRVKETELKTFFEKVYNHTSFF